MKRYQNPEIFERLALSYSVGTLHGRARERFERLMASHFYLRVVTRAYQQRISGLVELIQPVQPPARVWKSIEQQLNLKNHAAKPASSGQGRSRGFRSFLDGWRWPVTAFASVLVLSGALMLTNFLHPVQPAAYIAVLESDHQAPMAVATLAKGDMRLSVRVVDGMPAEKNKLLTLWCLPKQPGAGPLRMGTLASEGETSLPIDKAVWREMRDIGKFAISLEPMGHPEAKEPMGPVMYTGKLQATVAL